MEKIERIKAEITKLEARLQSATNRDERQSIGSALDAWNGLLMEARRNNA